MLEGGAKTRGPPAPLPVTGVLGDQRALAPEQRMFRP
jgi:hypothetical protein